jgi:twitching motility protein PilT
VHRINSFLELAHKQGGSDLHLVAGQHPRIRIHSVLHKVRFRELSENDLEKFLGEIMTPDQLERLHEVHSIGFAYEVPDIARFRVSVCRHHEGLSAVFRVLPTDIPPLETLGLPSSVPLTISQPKGLTLVTGPTGSGKSTTLASIIDHINRNRKGHIITIEDPIEFIHRFKKCVVSQREVGTHVPGFSDALRHAMREDPDIILLGELRDLESVSLALTAAETGIQVFGTLHTHGAPRTMDRIINIFPARRQEQIRSMLAESLRMIISQQLVRNAEGSGRLMVAEVLLNTPAAASMIRSGNSHKLSTVIQAGGGVGMQAMDAVLKNLVREGGITAEEAMEHAIDRSHFEALVARTRAA